ncbi:mitochondrial ribosomal subunit protein-domain-containing protein [Gautieria morchelliformis]|nr:mitochondrial ribosomal subunit protein-domain-containing protein [Gautieria morchelliformis]
MFAARRCVLPSTRLPVRQVHGSVVSYYRERKQTKRHEVEDLEFDIDFIPEFEEDDATAAAHLMIQQQKQILHYLRLIERDAPRLKAIRKPFVPPPDSVPLVVRSISYSGEEHPATKKRVVVVAISQLSLDSPQAIHKLKLLAGPRWSDKPPRDSGIGVEEDKRIGAHGYIKLSCEDFPEPAMNLKWGSDILDNLLKEANDPTDSFADLPHDQRHLDARARKHRKGEHVRGRPGHRPTIKDFPQQWLPPLPDQQTASRSDVQRPVL